MSRYFAIHGTMRTGSNLLEKSLAGLADVVCYGEAFNPGFVGGPRKTRLAGRTVAERDADPFGFLAALRADAGRRIPGFRIFDGHAPAIAEHTLADPDCARIVLTRDPLEAWVSLQIARETGQWMLRDPRRRRSAMIRFEPGAFCAWRKRIAGHYEWLDETMARAGTTALRIDYADLSDPATLAAAARHIGSTGALPETAPIVRQNPERLDQKVENYAELCAWLGRVPDPPAPPTRPGAGDVLLSRHLPLAHASMGCPTLTPALALMQRLEAAATGARIIAPARLAAAPAEHFRAGLERCALAREAAERHVFALVRHPAERLHGLFLEAGLGVDGPARRALTARTGPLPDLRAMHRGAPFPEALHRAAFDAYLDMVAEAVDGHGPLADDPARLSQTDLLDAYRATLRVDTVGRLERFPQLAATLAAVAGQPPLPPGQAAGLALVGSVERLPLARILDRAIAKRARVLHGRDHAVFGYETQPI